MIRPIVGIFARRNSTVVGLIIAQLATVAGAFIINILSARALGPSSRGEIAFVLQLSYIAGVVAPLGRDRALLQVLGKETSKDVRLRTIIGPTPIFIILASVAVLVSWRVLAGDPWGLIVLGGSGFGMLLAGNLFSRFTRSVAIVSSSTKRFIWATLLGQLLLVATGTALLASSINDVPLWIFAYGASLTLPFLVFVLTKVKTDAVGPSGPQRALIGKLGLAILPASLIDMVLTKVDKLLLPVLSTFTALGYYTIAASLVDFAILPFRQFVDSRIPGWARQYQDGTFRLLRFTGPIALSAVLIVGAVLAVAYAAIPVVFGEAYTPALPILPWLAIAAYFQILCVIVAGVATAMAMANYLRRMYVIAALFVVPAHIILVPSLGAAGAAISQAAAFGLCSAVGLIGVTRRNLSTERL